MSEKLAVVGAGMSGLIAAHVSDFKALVLESKDRPNTSFGDMVGARFIHESNELRQLFNYEGPSALCHVSTDHPESKDQALYDYIWKTRGCSLDDIPQGERESVMNWGQGSFPFLPANVNSWARETEHKAGVVYEAKVVAVIRDDESTQLHLANGQIITVNRVLFTLPLPVMMKIAGVRNGDRFQPLPTTVGRFGVNVQLPTTMHYITNDYTHITRITTQGTLLAVEASAYQSPALLEEMGTLAEDRLKELAIPRAHVSALGFSTFGHHIKYQPNFLADRTAALQSLERLGLHALGRYAQYSHRIKTLETYRRAKELIG